jgi:hypothetical protein
MCGPSLDLWIPKVAHSVSYLFCTAASKPYSMLTVSVQSFGILDVTQKARKISTSLSGPLLVLVPYLSNSLQL